MRHYFKHQKKHALSREPGGWVRVPPMICIYIPTYTLQTKKGDIVKIYCKKCRHLGSRMGDNDSFCCHPNNIGDWHSDKDPYGEPRYRLYPKDINANNDCDWFEVDRRV